MIRLTKKEEDGKFDGLCTDKRNIGFQGVNVMINSEDY